MRLRRREVRFCTSARSSSVWGSPKRPPHLSTKTTRRASSGVTTSLAKHIDIRKHFAHEVIQNGKMLLVRVPTASQLVDIFAKGLHYQQWQARVESILGKTFKPSLGTSDLKRGLIAESSGDRQGSQVESRLPLRGVLRYDLGMLRP